MRHLLLILTITYTTFNTPYLAHQVEVGFQTYSQANYNRMIHIQKSVTAKTTFHTPAPNYRPSTAINAIHVQHTPFASYANQITRTRQLR